MQLAPGSLQRDSRSDAPDEVGSRHQIGLVQICVGSIKRMTVEEYLDELMNGDVDDRTIESDGAASQITAEMSKIVDEVELQWLQPISDLVAFSVEEPIALLPPVDQMSTLEPGKIIAAAITSGRLRQR